MDEFEQGSPVEAKSSAKVVTNAKGGAQPEVKVYEGTTAAAMNEIVAVALDAYAEMRSKLGAMGVLA